MHAAALSMYLDQILMPFVIVLLQVQDFVCLLPCTAIHSKCNRLISCAQLATGRHQGSRRQACELIQKPCAPARPSIQPQRGGSMQFGAEHAPQHQTTLIYTHPSSPGAGKACTVTMYPPPPFRADRSHPPLTMQQPRLYIASLALCGV